MAWISWLVVFSLILSGCGSSDKNVVTEIFEETDSLNMADTSGMDFGFAEADTLSVDSSEGSTLNITSDTTVITDAGVQTYYITSGGTYTLSGAIY